MLANVAKSVLLNGGPLSVFNTSGVPNVANNLSSFGTTAPVASDVTGHYQQCFPIDVCKITTHLFTKGRPVMWTFLVVRDSQLVWLFDKLRTTSLSFRLACPYSRVNNEDSVTKLLQTSFTGLLWHLRVF